MEKKSGRKRKRTLTNSNLVDVKVTPGDQQPVKFLDQWPPQPWNQWLSNESYYQWPPRPWNQWPSNESYDHWPLKRRNQQPTGSRNLSSSEYWHDQANCFSYPWPQTIQQALQNIERPFSPLTPYSSAPHKPCFEPAPLQNNSAYWPSSFLYSKPVQDNHSSDTWSQYVWNRPQYNFGGSISSYYRRDVPVPSHSQSKARGDLADKLRSNISAVNHGNLKVVSVNANTIQSSSNDIASTSETVAERASKEPSPLRKVKMSRSGDLQVQVGNSDTPEDDVHYLYSVDPNEGKLVELVDLSEDSKIFESQDLLSPESKNLYIDVNSNSEVSDLTSLKDFTCDNPTNALVNNEKEKSDVENTPKEHGACRYEYCNVCNKSFTELLNNRCDLYSARCGHLFCGLCIKLLKIKSKCIQCNETISSLRKIVL